MRFHANLKQARADFVRDPKNRFWHYGACPRCNAVKGMPCKSTMGKNLGNKLKYTHKDRPTDE